jgi:hypothetical protein
LEQHAPVQKLRGAVCLVDAEIDAMPQRRGQAGRGMDDDALLVARRRHERDEGGRLRSRCE